MNPIEDELTIDRQLANHRQEELIQQHCTGLLEQLANTRTKEAAEQVVHDACARFDQSCESSVVRTFLKEHARALFRRLWESR